MSLRRLTLRVVRTPDIGEPTEHDLKRCALQPLTGPEDTDDFSVVTRFQMYGPRDGDLQPNDQVRYDGRLYDLAAGAIERWPGRRGYLSAVLELADFAAALPLHRRRAVAAMTATVAVRPPGGTSGELDPDTLEREFTPHAPVYTGPGEVRALGDGDDIEAGDNTLTVAGYTVEIDADRSGAHAVGAGHLVTCSGTGDPLLDDAELRVVEVVMGSTLTARQLRCELVTDV